MTNQKDRRPPNRTRCPRCNASWGGLNTAHCAACHETFTGPTGFDQHRAGQHATGHRHCRRPEDVTWGKNSKRAGERVFVDAGRDYPCWAMVGDDRKWWV